MKNVFILFTFLAITSAAAAQTRTTTKPKLVVGIIVDQMRQEYLFRYNTKFGKGGFNRMINEGFMVRNGHYNYAPTVTGPGHASVYTGTTPAIHGIISNSWYDKELKKDVNCVDDPNARTVGSEGEARKSASPARMITSTVTDELRLFTQKRAKVIGMSFKDRGAILPAGHMANAAYWYDGRTGRFISSTYYMNALPAWVDKFHAQKLADKYLSQEWKTLYPISEYIASGPDDSPYEALLGKEKTIFPYNLKELRDGNDYDLLSATPFANDYLTEFAKASVAGENLGADEVTDFLAVSYSTTDIIGHGVGPNAVELEDTYLRLDKNLEDLFAYLDGKVGKGQYTVFLTADHAVADVAQYLIDNRVPAGYFDTKKTRTELNEFLKTYFPGRDVIEEIDGDQLYLNHEAFQREPKSSGVEFMVASELIVNYLKNVPGVANAYSESIIRTGDYMEGGIKGMVIRGYHPRRSGDIVIVLEPGWYGSGSKTGTTHGSPYTYDTHVPMLFFGAGIPHGTSTQYHRITDIAPTISMLLDIKLPNGATGLPITEILDKQ